MFTTCPQSSLSDREAPDKARFCSLAQSSEAVKHYSLLQCDASSSMELMRLVHVMQQLGGGRCMLYWQQ